MYARSRKNGKGIKDFSETHIKTQLESSLKRLKRESVEIFQLHNPPPEIWQGDEVFSLLNKLKKEGKIKAIGVSISTMEEGIHLIRSAKVDLLQVLFNVLNQAPADVLLPLAEENKIGVIARVPLASGLLTGKFDREQKFASDDNRRNYLTPRRLAETLEKVDELRETIQDTGYTTLQVALAFLLRFSVVPIPGAKTVQQLEQNLASTEIVLTDKLFLAIRKAFAGFNFYLRHKVHV